MVFDAHLTYEKTSVTCRQCGACCDQNCPQFRWVAIQDRIRKDTVFVAGVDIGVIRGHCLIFDSDKIEGNCTPDQRQNFPYNPWQTPKKCAFKWQVKTEV